MRARAVVLWCACAVGAELVFHVPDVLVSHEPAPDRAVGTGPHKETRAAAVSARTEASHGDEAVTYQEYFVEHEISTVDARRAATQLSLHHIPERYPGCGTCSREELAYCEYQVVSDHCCCERRFQEPYPWIPHTCYAGPEPCRPVARDCGLYRRLRDCCCDRRLAEKWKSLLAAAPQAAPAALLLLSLLATPVVLQLLLR